MIRGWQIEQDADLKRALENLRGLVPKLRNDKTLEALQAEIQQCSEELHNYPEKITEELQTMLEIHRHIVSLQKEQGKLLSQVSPLPGANNG